MSSKTSASASVLRSNIQSCSCSPPSPIGCSTPTFGLVLKPSTDIEWSIRTFPIRPPRVRWGLRKGESARATILKLMLQRAEREPVDRLFHALADPNRRGIVERLSLGPATVSELAEPLPMSLSAVVQHLQVLQVSGLVRSEKVGRVRTCRIEPAALLPVERWIGERRSSWERRLDRLGAYLAEHSDEPDQQE